MPGMIARSSFQISLAAAVGAMISITFQACSRATPAGDRRVEHLVKVLAVNFEPRVEGRALHAAMHWQDPRDLAGAYAADVHAASGETVRFQVVDWRDIGSFPRKVDGFRYTIEDYLRNHRDERGWHQPDAADYRQIFGEQNIPAAIDSGAIDEVWFFGGPYFGYSESAMAGPGAFYINGEVFGDVAVQRPFAIMGFNLERGVAEMLENLCHRVEATMSRIYAGWRADALNDNWARFAASQAQSGSAAVGSCHWPPNAEREYDWDNPRLVTSTADTWLRYPNLDRATSDVNRETWGGPDYARNYFRWWFAHLPRNKGINADGRLNNWWTYVFDFAQYDERGKARTP